MANKSTSNTVFSPQAREAGRNARIRQSALRARLAKRWGLRPSDLYKTNILKTIAEHNIPPKSFPDAFLPVEARGEVLKAEKKPSNGNGHSTTEWVGIPLDVIPEKVLRGRNSTPKPNVKKFTKPPALGDNMQLVHRLLDIVEKLL